MFVCEKLYRLSSFLKGLRLGILSTLVDYLNRIVFSCWVPGSIVAGNNLILGYGGLGIIIHGDCRLGSNVHIDQHVTLGGNATSFGVPTVGNDVYIGAGAKILGPVKIGNDVVVAANSVVLGNVADGQVVAGVPARVVKSGIRLEEHIHHLKT